MKTAREWIKEHECDEVEAVTLALEARDREVRAAALRESVSTEHAQLRTMLERVGFPSFEELNGPKARAIEIHLPWAEHDVGFSFNLDGSLAKDATIYFVWRRRS